MQRVVVRTVAYGLMVSLLAACDQRPAATERATAPVAPPVAPPVAAASATVAPRAADTTDLTQPALPRPVADTVLRINGQLCRLLIATAPDSSRPLLTTWKRGAQIDTSRGVDIRYQFTLRNAVGQAIFEKQLRKSAFYAQCQRIL